MSPIHFFALLSMIAPMVSMPSVLLQMGTISIDNMHALLQINTRHHVFVGRLTSVAALIISLEDLPGISKTNI